MAYTTGSASSYLDLMDKLRRYAAGFGTAGAAVPDGGNAGDGTVTGIDTYPATVTETITLTCTAGGPTGTFSVSGSVTGALADATVGTPYTSAVIDFTINDGAADFIIGDTFTIATTQGALSAAGEEWTVMRWTGGNELILRGQGLDGNQEIYVGMRGVFDVGTDYYNWETRGYTGYDGGMDFDLQPGVSDAAYLSLWNSTIPYWFVVNGQRIIVVAKVSTTYHLGYWGYWYPYGQPSAFPYPLLISASTGSRGVRWSSNNETHSNLTQAKYVAGSLSFAGYGARFYAPDGAWYPIGRYDLGASYAGGFARLWPFSRTNTVETLSEFDVNPDGSYPLIPSVLVQERPVTNLLGELDGIFATTGQGLATEDIIQVSGVDYLAVQNIFRTGRDDYVAVKLA
jgi:hypothetical protein